MSRLKALVLLILAGLYANGASAGETGAQLSFFQHRDGKTEWMFWSAVTNRTNVFIELPAPPSLVFWELQPGAILFVSDNRIFRAVAGGTPAKGEQVAVLPGGRGKVRALWRDSASQRLRVATMFPIKEPDVLNENGKIKYRLPDGTKLAGMTVPDWGTPYACSVLELEADGTKWKLLATRATKDEAGDTPGMSVVQDLRTEAGYSAARLTDSYSCLNGQCVNTVPEELAALASRLTKRKLPSEELSIWRPGAGMRSVLFGTIMGDELHMTPPVIILSPDEKSGQSLPTGGMTQLSLGVKAGLLLVSDETNGGHPVIVDLQTGKIRFSAPEAISAVWVPAH